MTSSSRSIYACLLFLPFVAAAQVTVQEYALPPGHRVHDVWADAAPGGPVWFSARFKSSSRYANVRQIHGGEGEVWTPESAADKIVVYRFE